ncbi:MAG: ArsR/SmtB family transcription factor [Candidatus Methanofastidiosia archaeon]
MMIYKQGLLIKAKFFRGLADSTRLLILETLLDGEKKVSEIVEATKQSQSNVSNHLRCLYECGFVMSHRDGKNIYYSLRDEEVKKLLESADKILSRVYDEIVRCVNYER